MGPETDRAGNDLTRGAAALRTLVAVGGFGFATVCLAYYAFLNVFTYLAFLDDEGYMLISLDLFRQGHALYDAVYSQYGPAYFEIMDTLLTVLRLDVTHDNGRFITTALWTGTALIGGLTIFGLTRNVWLGFAVQAILTQSLLSLRRESMHPGALICFLVVCISATVLLIPRRPRLAWTLLGVLSALVILVKINVGVFASLAIGFVALSASARSRVLLWIAGAGIVGTPALLMASNFTLPWVRQYIILVSAALLPLVVILIRNRPTGPVPVRWLLTGAVGTTTLVCAVAMLQGTSLGALFNAVVIAPLGHPKIFMIPPDLPSKSTVFAVIASAIGVWAAWRSGKPVGPDNPDRLSLSAFFRIIAGLAIWITVPGLLLQSPLGFFLAPLAWLAAVPPRNLADSPALSFARRFLPLFAVLQTLHAYPVAGSHVWWSSFLLILIGAICIFDGARQLASLMPAPMPLTANFVGIALCLLTAAALWQPARIARWTYAGNQPLGLPGAQRVHAPSDRAADIVNAARFTRENCTTFLTAPGLPSFYFWTERKPPTTRNVGAWLYLFDEATQRKIIEDADRVENLCVIRSEPIMAVWIGGRPIPPSPLLEYISQNFAPVAQFGRYELLKRRRQ